MIELTLTDEEADLIRTAPNRLELDRQSRGRYGYSKRTMPGGAIDRLSDLRYAPTKRLEGARRTMLPPGQGKAGMTIGEIMHFVECLDSLRAKLLTQIDLPGPGQAR